MRRAIHGKKLTSLMLSLILLLATFTFSAAAQDVPTKHHSKVKGALVGGAAGALIGGKKGAVVGAGAGALIQHHRNKRARRRQQVR